jgi:predicted enzyme related to lactoylglutathione lyase
MVSEVPGDQVSSGPEDEHRVFRVGGISYLRIPAEDSRRSAAFYEAVFGWSLRGDPDDPSFDDGTGHVIGHFMTDLPVAGEAGVCPYIFVERADETLEKVVAHGGAVVTAPYPEGELWVATFRDPPGNVIGVWQLGSADVTE